jgi:hypothetical protein
MLDEMILTYEGSCIRGAEEGPFSSVSVKCSWLGMFDDAVVESIRTVQMPCPALSVSLGGDCNSDKGDDTSSQVLLLLLFVPASCWSGTSTSIGNCIRRWQGRWGR